MNRRKFIYIVLTLLNMGLITAQGIENLSQGEKLFKENKPKEAVQVLENELLNGIVTANTYNFLGLGYYQLGEFSKSIDAFDRGIKAQPTNIKILSFNQGNTYYAMKDFASAVNCFTRALNDDSKFYDALLNRANALLMGNQLVAAKSDYIDFVEKCPDDVQKAKIELLIQALTDEIARREEEERLLREQNKAMWEAVDPSFDEALAEEVQWEKIDADIEEEDNENKTPWENVDASIAEQETAKQNVDWEDVDTSIGEHKEPVKTKEWEKIENTSSQISSGSDKTNSERIADERFRENNSDSEDWEKLDSEKIGRLSEYDYYKDELEYSSGMNWENLSDEESMELKRLERESREEYEKWLEEQSLIRQRKAEDELRRLQQKDEEERLARQKMLEDLMKAEEERRKKLLDDVANSLQNGNSTNISSGTDDLIDYDLEGELD